MAIENLKKHLILALLISFLAIIYIQQKENTPPPPSPLLYLPF
jgi:hypothetical protein